jgi:two-component system, cell cycle response regulator DivK
MKRVLVIEDNPDNLLLVHMLLGPLEVQLTTAMDGPSGIDAAKAQGFDLILLDIQLPGMDGYQVVKALRALPGLADTPIMAITSYAMAGDREKAMLEGFTEYIEKPINPDTFQETIASLL